MPKSVSKYFQSIELFEIPFCILNFFQFAEEKFIEELENKFNFVIEMNQN